MRQEIACDKKGPKIIRNIKLFRKLVASITVYDWKLILCYLLERRKMMFFYWGAIHFCRECESLKGSNP
jgi:hypothetical protein